MGVDNRMKVGFRQSILLLGDQREAGALMSPSPSRTNDRAETHRWTAADQRCCLKSANPSSNLSSNPL